MHPLRLLAPLVAALMVAAASAQSPFLLVGVGDEVPGVGEVTGIEAVLVDGNGWWLVQASTDNPAVPSVVFREGLVWSKVGDPLPALPGATLARFGGWSEDLFGGLARKVSLAGTAGGASDDQAIVWDTTLHLQTGTPTALSTPDFPPGTLWASFGEARYGRLATDFVLTGTVADPALPSSERTFLALASQVGSPGVCCDVKVVVEEGWIAPGVGDRIQHIRTTPRTACIDAHGTRLLWSCDTDGPAATDGCVYFYLVLQQTPALLAREGFPSPVAGRAWGPLEDLSLDLYGGFWTLRTLLDASDPDTDGVIVRSGVKLVQEGDSLPGIAPFVLDDLGRGRAVLDSTGRALWYGHWNDPAGAAEGLFLDAQVLVRAGTTSVHGLPLVDLAAGPESYDLAPTGDYVVFTGTLADGREGAFALNLGKLKGYCPGKQNSLGCFVHSSVSGAPSASAGSGFRLRADSVLSQVPGLLFYGTAAPLAAPFGDATLCVRPPLRRLPPTTSGGSPPPASACDGLLEADFNAWIATGQDPGLVAGTTVFAQFWARDPGFGPPLDFVLTQAFEFPIGP